MHGSCQLFKRARAKNTSRQSLLLRHRICKGAADAKTKIAAPIIFARARIKRRCKSEIYTAAVHLARLICPREQKSKPKQNLSSSCVDNKA